MAGNLEALLLRAEPSALARLAELHLPAVPLIRQSGLCLVPVTEAANSAVHRQRVSEEIVPGFYNLTASMAAWAAELSESTPVAYIHVEFFGGMGFHAAIGWSGGEVAWGPRFTANNPADVEDYFELVHSIADMAVNDVLRWLGVEAQGRDDEFEAVGLTRFRFTDEWEQAARQS